MLDAIIRWDVNRHSQQRIRLPAYSKYAGDSGRFTMVGVRQVAFLAVIVLMISASFTVQFTGDSDAEIGYNGHGGSTPLPSSYKEIQSGHSERHLDVWAPAKSYPSEIYIGGHTVVFNSTSGLRFDIVSHSDSSLSFTVEGEDGLSINPATIEVIVEDRPVEPVNGIFTLDGIDGDTTVYIDGEPYYSQDPGEVPEFRSIPVWAVLLAFAFVFAAAAVMVWFRGRNLDSST